MVFECPTCSNKFAMQAVLKRHMENHNQLMGTISMVSGSDRFFWTYVTCNICETKFQNEQDVAYHKRGVQQYDEICCLNPCEECGLKGEDSDSEKSHKDQFHRGSPGHNTDFEEDFDDVDKSQDDELLLQEDEDYDFFLPNKTAPYI